MKMNEKDVNTFYTLLEDNKTFIVTSHISPDGDSLGSLLAMAHALSVYDKVVIPIVNDDIPKKYTFLPGADLIKTDDAYMKRADVLIALDCGDENRLGFKNDLKQYAKKIINIDHHKSNTFFGDLNIVDSAASSAGEIVYQLLEGKLNIDYETSLCLYTSIVTDTGSLRYANTTSTTLKILADLVDNGVKPDVVSRHVFEQRSLESVNLLALALGNLKIFEDGKVACIFVTQDMLRASGAKEEDTEGIINYAREIEGVEVGILFKEQADSTVKIGLRSNRKVDVRKIAESFKGGGHIRAAGCSLDIGLREAEDVVLNTVREFLIEA